MAEQLLMNAVEKGDLQQVSTLIVETNADVDFIDEGNRGFTPCHLASENGLMSVLELILTYNCDPNIPSNEQVGYLTPLHIATSKGYKKIVETLLNYYADPNMQDINGYTPLHIACRKGFLEIAKLLLAKGADVEIKDEQGKTPYYWAQEYKHDEILPFLEVFAFSSMKDLPPMPLDPATEAKAREKLALYDYTKHHDSTKVTIHVIKKQDTTKTKKKTTKKKKK
ncbi:ankyrin-repeat-containing protein [Naegleria gruberi]|uniref:Ankyrin-repeat-containing protein n=1 Tax=Naegleria gruberi TaxID=5762 RepID=D2V9R4_NAEGR|nr:ankyrin-repeat-containing protein [Naegleria gruberi]EFC46513.1 ankyrin-repeat-containing protein [Naegleria gruberi]|eukprot:XP_002679257.1 ankyrin-repeat-containing protein [Naegleria gruberi strain NEG-M]